MDADRRVARQAAMADPAELADWDRVLTRDGVVPDRFALYAPLLAPAMSPDGCFVLGRIAQSLDGRIATASGESFWISGPEDIVHTHRLRALFQAIVVGAGTVLADDPLLTTRECAGPSPVRVILDTQRRLMPERRVFGEGPPTLLIVADDCAGPAYWGHAEVVAVPRAADGVGVDPVAVVAELGRRGLRRVFVEGGGITVSRFLAAGMLDRLHVTVAPLLLGGGIPSFTLKQARLPADGLRLDWTVHQLGEDVLFDIRLDRTKPPSCL